MGLGELIDIIPTKCTLGEGIVYCHRAETVLWMDIEGKRLYRLFWPSKELEHFDMPERATAIALTEKPETLLLALETGFAFYTFGKDDVEWIDRPLLNIENVRMNDGRVDPYGNFWCGAMAEHEDKDTIKKSCLYRLSGDGQITTHKDNIHISNSICWSPDGTTMYFADSMQQTIWSADFHIGDIHSDWSVVRTYAGDEAPDGSVVDCEGYLWNAVWGGSRLQRMNDIGDIVGTIDLPISQPTCLHFGGGDMNTIFITTARQNLSPGALKNEQHAGALLILTSDIKGQHASIFGQENKKEKSCKA